MKITDAQAHYLRLPGIQARTDSSQDALIFQVDTWIVWFPLRHLDVAPVVAVLDRFGYRTDMLTTLRQRRFKDADERRVVLRQLGQRGLDPNDAECGYSHAVCRVSRPSGPSASLS